MEAHRELMSRGFFVRSCGTGASVKLPGPSIDRPNVYPFTTSYDVMFTDLMHKDENLYRRNGVLPILDRNRTIKRNPERWYDMKEKFDIVLCFEERVFEAVMDDFVCNRTPFTFDICYVINMEVRDSPADAVEAAKVVGDLLDEIDVLDERDDNILKVLEKYERLYGNTFLITPVFY